MKQLLVNALLLDRGDNLADGEERFEIFVGADDNKIVEIMNHEADKSGTRDFTTAGDDAMHKLESGLLIEDNDYTDFLVKAGLAVDREAIKLDVVTVDSIIEEMGHYMNEATKNSVSIGHLAMSFVMANGVYRFLDDVIKGATERYV